MRILITNFIFGTRSGTENVAELLADSLRIAGHDVMIFAPTLVDDAHWMLHTGHLIYNDIDHIPYRPDVIHAHHVSPCFIAMLRFPDVPVVYTCHSSTFELEAPLLHPQIKHYVAVDEACKDRCLSRGVPADRLTVIHNAVDALRYISRPPLPDRPKHALLLTKLTGVAEPVKRACAEMNIALDELGRGTNRFSNELEKELPKYDIVFATARMALEAAFVGCAVIVCDARGFAGLITSKNVALWRKNNFGVRLLTRPTTYDLLQESIKRYDANDAANVTNYVRLHAPADKYISQYEKLYRSAIKAGSAHISALGSANGRWAQELVATAEKRLWFRIASEMGWMPNTKTVELMLDQSKSDVLTELRSIAERQSDSAGTLETHIESLKTKIDALDREVLSSIDILMNLKAMYQALVPSFLRRMGAQLRARSKRGKS
ncbi:glycosyltransferase [Phyllobacterium meliloti]|uniref:glycosyltransferase n=1 Tax=Phyllobacterium meliloti TaxID=555317 RepID=UPI000DDFB9DF|nr:glycosyltransferase [Phyllobacterium sp. T1293]UGX87728.1 glycosyltransferase family 4 protein [Phyllobacterium sp. T1293]